MHGHLPGGAVESNFAKYQQDRKLSKVLLYTSKSSTCHHPEATGDTSRLVVTVQLNGDIVLGWANPGNQLH